MLFIRIFIRLFQTFSIYEFHSGDATMHSPNHLPLISPLTILLSTWNPCGTHLPTRERRWWGDGWENANKHFPFHISLSEEI
jgi:hypothetical protein